MLLQMGSPIKDQTKQKTALVHDPMGAMVKRKGDLVSRKLQAVGGQKIHFKSMIQRQDLSGKVPHSIPFFFLSS